MATGTWAMAWKLPLSDGSVGTAAQPAPNVAIESAEDGAMVGAIVVVVGAAAVLPESVESSLPQAVSEIEKATAAARAVSFVARMVFFLHLSGLTPVIRSGGARG
ncbi:hypothetical protein GCM10010436_47240 [Paractinoplanes durhamensis]